MNTLKNEVFDDFIEGNFSNKDVTLDVCSPYENEHGKYIELEFSYKSNKTNYIMQVGNLLWALELYSKNNCTATGINIRPKEDVAQ